MSKPKSVKWISVFYLIEGISALILGGLLLAGGGILATIPMLSALSVLLVPSAVFVLLIGAFNIFVYKSLSKGKNWARIYAIVISLIGVVSGIMSIATVGLLSGVLLIVHGGILYYLLIDKKTKSFFR